MSFYSNLAKTASNLLNRYGQKVVFTRTVKGEYDPAEGERTGDSTITFKGFGALLDFDFKQMDGENIISGDVRLLLESISKTPQINDIVTANGKSYVVLNVKELNPAGTQVMTECHLRVGTHGNIR